MKIYKIKLIAIFVLSILFIPFIINAAWTTAPASPPSNNTDSPINVGSTFQNKDGSVGFRGWNYISNKNGSIVSIASSDERPALIFGASDTSTSWFLGSTASGQAMSTDAFGIYSWNTGWSQIWKPNGDVEIGKTGMDTQINGTITIKGGTPGANKVLVSDANGKASWGSASGSSNWGSIALTANTDSFDTNCLYRFQVTDGAIPVRTSVMGTAAYFYPAAVSPTSLTYTSHNDIISYINKDNKASYNYYDFNTNYGVNTAYIVTNIEKSCN